jgi:peptidoglycan/LPS O-acetylase OafA/YrhL
MAVILLHFFLRIFFSTGIRIGAPIPGHLAYALFRNGDNGVKIFFAISGFLITRTSIRRFGSLSNMQPAIFYRTRFARIAPLLLLLLAVLSVLHLAHIPSFVISPKVGTLPRALFAALTFHLNWLEAARGYLPANWDVLWSLSIEEMFYLFFPLVCFLLLKKNRWGSLLFFALLLCLIVAGPFPRSLRETNAVWRDISYFGSMDGIAMGCLTALAVEHFSKKNITRGILLALEAAGAFLLLWIFYWPTFHWMRFIARSGIYGTVLALGTCLILFASTLRRREGSRWTAPIRWIGRNSYEIYLTHEFIVIGMTLLYVRIHRGPTLLWAAAVLGLAAIFGAYIAHTFSEPLNRTLRRAR